MSRNEEHLRSRIAAATGRKDYPDPAWEVLVARGHVADYLAHRVNEERFVDYARALAFYGEIVEHAASPPASGDGRANAQPPPLGRSEGQRAMTLAGYLELRVAAYPAVLEWRREAWGTPGPAPSYAAYDLVEDAETLASASLPPDADNEEVEPSGHLEYFGSEPGQVHLVPVYRGSVLERLRDLGETLIEELFPLWSRPEAAWVVVTGEVWEVPGCLTGEIQGFSNQYLTYRTIDLRVEPWIPADTVTRAYQSLQSRVLGRKPRALSERNLTMARFVMQRLRDLVADGSEGGGGFATMSWRRVMAQWNQAHPDWAYDDERQFYRDIRRVTRSVARPYDEELLSRENSGLAHLSIPRKDPGEKQT